MIGALGIVGAILSAPYLPMVNFYLASFQSGKIDGEEVRRRALFAAEKVATIEDDENPKSQ